MSKNGSGARVVETCGKCGGSGSVSWGAPVAGRVRDAEGGVRIVGKVCFSCGGVGSRSILVSSVRARERRRTKAAELAQAKAAKAREHRAEVEVKVATFAEAEPGVWALLKGIDVESSSGFLRDMRYCLDKNGELSQRQMDALRRVVREREESVEVPVGEGRVGVAGVIRSWREVDSGYGNVVKITVRDGRGFTVYGSLPKRVSEDLYWKWYQEVREPLVAEVEGAEGGWFGPYAYLDWAVKEGVVVEFEASLERSQNDKTFGFFKRPR